MATLSRDTDPKADRQWRDARGVPRVPGERLDREYMERWAVEIGVADLLDRAWKDTTGPALSP